MVLPVQDLLVLAEIQEAEAPKHHRQRRLLQRRLTQSKVDRVLTEAHFLLQKTEQSPRWLRLRSAADHHGRQSF